MAHPSSSPAPRPGNPRWSEHVPYWTEARREAGLSPYEALVTGTRNPAEFLGVPGSFGTIEVGKRADFVLLDANPLEDIANVQRVAGVMAAGRWLPRDTIDARLEELAARH